MAKQQMTARVTLKKSKTYKFKGTQWIKDVPRVIAGKELITEFQNNGFFNVKVLKDEIIEKKTSKKKPDEDSGYREPKKEKRELSGGKASKGKKLLKK